MTRLLTPEEAAQILRLKNPKTLTKWARLNYVPAHPLGAGDGKRRIWRFVESELVAWAESKQNKKGGLGPA
jgi:hypothetical protein